MNSIRYHTLLDKQTRNENLRGRPKDEVLGELQEYVQKSIDFVAKYNEDHKINGKGVISSVDLFNEIVSFEDPYRNMWEELYGISTEELVSVFQYALENKPDGVTYVYNEPFLENPERRQVVIEQLSEINELAPGLIDTIENQMHIEMTQNLDDIRHCFGDLKKLEQLGIGTQIKEFDMCLPERFMFDEKGKIRSEHDLVEIINSKISKSGITIGSIAEFKSMRMNEISKAIEETGIQLDGITYWSISDILDHNLERTNRKTYEQAIQRDIAQTRYSGLYSDLEKNQKLSSKVNVEEFGKFEKIGEGKCANIYKSGDNVYKILKENTDQNILFEDMHDDNIMWDDEAKSIKIKDTDFFKKINENSNLKNINYQSFAGTLQGIIDAKINEYGKTK